LLGNPVYYRRFGLHLTIDHHIAPPQAKWQPHFQVRLLTAYDPQLRGPFTYPEPFSRV
jgi:putative acetyltransferase